MRFRKGFEPCEDVLRRVALERGYEIAGGTISIGYTEQQSEWHFVAVAVNKDSAAPISALAGELTHFDGVEKFNLSPARN